MSYRRRFADLSRLTWMVGWFVCWLVGWLAGWLPLRKEHIARGKQLSLSFPIYRRTLFTKVKQLNRIWNPLHTCQQRT